MLLREICMSDVKRRSTIQDLAKKRWKYLFTRAGANTLWGYAMLLTIASGTITIGLVLLLFASTWIDPFYMQFSAYAIVTGPITLLGIWNLREAKQIAERASYVPPVKEQIEALPAEEVLVRGSDQPAATCDELLRATNEVSQTPAEELLRSGARSSGE
jgi:hypothetical protein